MIQSVVRLKAKKSKNLNHQTPYHSLLLLNDPQILPQNLMMIAKHQPMGAASNKESPRELTETTLCEDLDNKNNSVPEILEDSTIFDYLPSNFALVGGLNTDPKMLDEALFGPNAKEWQAALDYEISQLKKFETWVVKTYLRARWLYHAASKKRPEWRDPKLPSPDRGRRP